MTPSTFDTGRHEAPATGVRWLIGVRHWSVSAKLIVMIAPLLILFLVLFVWAFAGRQRIQMLDQQTTATAEAILTQIQADREHYASTIVPRLSAIQASISADYHRTPNAFPLLATFLREVTEMIANSPSAYRVKLISPWPINKKNGIQDSFQKEGFDALLTTNTRLFKRQEQATGPLLYGFSFRTGPPRIVTSAVTMPTPSARSRISSSTTSWAGLKSASPSNPPCNRHDGISCGWWWVEAASASL